MIKLDIKLGKHKATSTVAESLLVSDLRDSIAQNLNEKHNQSFHPENLWLYVGNRKLWIDQSLGDNGVNSGDTIVAVEGNNLQHYSREGYYPGHIPLSQRTSGSMPVGVQPYTMLLNSTRQTSMMEMPPYDSNADLPVIPRAIVEEDSKAWDRRKHKLELPKYVSFDDLLKHKKFTKRMREQCKESGAIRFADVFLLGLYESTYRFRKLRKKTYILLVFLFIFGIVFISLLWVVLFEEIRDIPGLESTMSSIERITELETLGQKNASWWSFGSAIYSSQDTLKVEFAPWLIDIDAEVIDPELIIYGRMERSVTFEILKEVQHREMTVYDERAETWQWIQLHGCFDDLSFSDQLTLMCQIWDYSTFRYYYLLCPTDSEDYCIVLGPADLEVTFPHSTFCDASDDCSGGSFHEDSIVWVESTYPQTRSIPTMMKHVRAGDRVLSISPSGVHFFDLVWFNLHAAGPRFTRFSRLLEIEVVLPNATAGIWLYVTLDHMLFFSEIQAKAARKFSIGETIFTSQGSAKVARRRLLPPRPVRSLLTMKGRYIVGPVSNEHNSQRQEEPSFGVLCDNLVEGMASELSKLPLLTKLLTKLEYFRRLRRYPIKPVVDWLIQVIVDVYVYLILSSRLGLFLFAVLLPIVDIAVVGLTLCSVVTFSDFLVVACLLSDDKICLELSQCLRYYSSDKSFPNT